MSKPSRGKLVVVYIFSALFCNVKELFKKKNKKSIYIVAPEPDLDRSEKPNEFVPLATWAKQPPLAEVILLLLILVRRTTEHSDLVCLKRSLSL